MTRPPKHIPLPCPDCDGFMHLQRKPRGWTGKSRWTYLCENYGTGCRGKVSAHPDGRPTGPPAPQQIRTLRSRCHEEAFDPLWKDAEKIYDIKEEADSGRRDAIARIRFTARKRAYAWLAIQLGMTHEKCHIGQITDAETLDKIYELCRAQTTQGIRDFWKQGKGAAG